MDPRRIGRRGGRPGGRDTPRPSANLVREALTALATAAAWAGWGFLLLLVAA